MHNSYKYFLLFFVLTFGLYVLQAQTTATKLGDLAASMAPGTWKELETNGLNANLLDAGQGHYILEYTEDAKWDPNSQKYMLIGQGHYAELKHITYDAYSNSWVEEAKPYWAGGIGHGYDQNAINPLKGIFYFIQFNSPSVYQYNISQKKWSSLPEVPEVLSCCRGMEYFPEMGGLILAGGGKVYFYDDATATWSMLASDLSMGEYHNFVEYNPVYKVVIFGGGNDSNDLYKIDSDGIVSRLGSAPLPLGIQQSITTVDPVGGDYLVFGSNGLFFTYNVSTDSWSQQHTSVPFFSPELDSPINGTVASPVSTYGVTMFLKFYWDESKVYIYKHTAGGSASHILRVGPDRDYKLPSDAAKTANDGDTILIDPGNYDDSAVWPQSRITIRGFEGTPHIQASGQLAEDKSIWVLKGNNITIQNIEFSGVSVTSSAALWQEGSDLILKNCNLHDNTSAFICSSDGDVLIESSEIANNGASPTLDIKRAHRFTLKSSNIYNTKNADCVQTRAEENFILYNQIMDRENGSFVHAITFPDGDKSYVIGNSFHTRGAGPLVLFAGESFTIIGSSLSFVNNTVVYDQQSGNPFQINELADSVKIYNNLFVGDVQLADANGELKSNLITQNPAFVDRASFDYHLTYLSNAIDEGIDPGSMNNFNLWPVLQYVPSLGSESRPVNGPLDVGAFEYSETRLPAPAITPNGGSFEGSVVVALTTSVTGADIFYTTDGSTPDRSSLLYTVPLKLNSSTTLNAVATKAGFPISSVSTAQFTVGPDHVRPFILSVSAQLVPSIIIIHFSEKVDATSAEDVTNYSVSNDVTINSVSLNADGKSVTLMTSQLAAGVSYTLTVNNIRDVAALPNTIADNTQYNFTSDARVNDGLQALYTFREGSGAVVRDVSGIEPALDLTIASPSNIQWGEGFLSVKGTTTISSEIASKIIDACKASNEITIEAWILPASSNQSGPARIVTLSADAYTRDFTLGQEGSSFDVRLRTTTTGENGMNPSLNVPLDNLTLLTHIVYTRSVDGNAQVYINGAQVANRADIGGDFSNWADFRFALANELNGNREWMGDYHLVAIYSRALTFEQVQQNFAAGPYSNALQTGFKKNNELPNSLQLNQNYPNPFNAATTIEFALAKDQVVQLTIFSISGQQVSSFAEKLSPGLHTFNWDASAFPSGIYLYRLVAGAQSLEKKMLLLK